jgi:5-methylcytosine-specific restriction endonuclease McrA
VEKRFILTTQCITSALFTVSLSSTITLENLNQCWLSKKLRLVRRKRMMTKSETKRFAMCPRCLEFKPLTVHHVLPRRFFGNNIFRVRLCRRCHDIIEDVIRKLEQDRGGKLKNKEYISVTKVFMKGG